MGSSLAVPGTALVVDRSVARSGRDHARQVAGPSMRIWRAAGGRPSGSPRRGQARALRI